MSKILELCSKRNALWEQTKAFLEKNRGENGLVGVDAVEQYNKMAKEVKDLSEEIKRLEEQAEIDARLSAPTSSQVHDNLKNGTKPKDARATNTEEYSNAFWNMIRGRGSYSEIRNAIILFVEFLLLVASIHMIPTGCTDVKVSFGQIQEERFQSGQLNFTILFLEGIHVIC